MNINQLKYFQLLGELKHYTQAAEILGITQPSLSYAITSLEEELGFKLFQKSGRNIVLSTFGEEFLRYVNQSSEILENGIHAIQKRAQKFEQTLDIAYVAPLGYKFIPLITKEYSELFQTKINLHMATSDKIILGLKEGRFDIGFCSQMREESALKFQAILKQEMILLVPRGSKLKTYSNITLEEICNHELITYAAETGLGMIINTAFRKSSIVPNVKYYAQDELTIGGLVEQNLGIGLAADSSILNQFKVDKIPLDETFISRIIYTAFRKEGNIPKIERFKKYLNKYSIEESNNFF